MYHFENRVQIATDGQIFYLEAMEIGFGPQVDYAILVNLLGLDLLFIREYSSRH
jgi:hypothetical protein